MAGARPPATRPGLGDLIKDPLLENLHRDPRWNAFLRTMGWPTSN
jgi:hypothetical protein